MNTMKYIGVLYCFDCFFGSVAVQYQLNIVKTCFLFILYCDTHWIRNCSLLTWCEQTNTISSDISTELVREAAMCVFPARPALLLLLLLAAVWCIRGWYLHLWESTRRSCILSLDVHPCGNGPIWLKQIQVAIANQCQLGMIGDQKKDTVESLKAQPCRTSDWWELSHLEFDPIPSVRFVTRRFIASEFDRICLLGHQHSRTRSELVKYVSQHLNPYCNGRLFCCWLHSFATFLRSRH